MRFDEELAKDLLVAHLCDEHSVEPMEGDNPPDYWFIIDGTRYAVEVTRVESGNNLALIAMAERFSQEMRALLGSVLSGTYVLDWTGFPPSSNQRVRKTWATELRGYIGRSATAPQYPKELLCSDEGFDLFVEKRLGPPFIGWTLGTGLGGWEGDVADQLDELLAPVLDGKRKKLAGQTCPIVLALIDGYWLATPDEWIQALERQSDSFFSGIYLFPPSGYGSDCIELRHIGITV